MWGGDGGDAAPVKPHIDPKFTHNSCGPCLHTPNRTEPEPAECRTDSNRNRPEPEPIQTGTDSAAVLRALEIDANLIIKATKVDGVYDKDPVKYSDAVKYDRLTYDTVLKQGLRVMDAAGIALAKEDKKPILVMNMTVPGNVRKAVLGENVGTLISLE